MAIMRKTEVLAVTGLCSTTVYNLEKKGKFPAHKKPGCRAVGWVKEEVDSWIAGLAYIRYGGSLVQEEW